MPTAHRPIDFKLTTEQQARLQQQREQIAAERPQLQAKLERIHEAKQEPSFCGQLRQAIHSSGRLITHLAAEAGITTQQLSDFLAGDRTLRSDVLDRLTAAVGASLIVAERKSCAIRKRSVRSAGVELSAATRIFARRLHPLVDHQIRGTPYKSNA